MNPQKATGPDGIPIKVIKNKIKLNSFTEFAKVASVRPLYKKEGRCKITYYWPVSILNAFSKVCETYLLNCLTSFVNKLLSDFVSAYRRKFSSNHVLKRLIEDWKKSLYNKNIVGVVLIDLAKAFDCIPHDLLIAKMTAYRFSIDTIVFMYSYLLKRRKENVKI